VKNVYSNLDFLTIISDNVFFTLGMSDNTLNSIVLDPYDYFNNNSNHISKIVVISVDNYDLRRNIILDLIKIPKVIVIFDKILKPGSYFKIRNVIYVSPSISNYMLYKLVSAFDSLRALYFTAREQIFLDMSFLRNEDISTLMKISIKTCSGYRTSIKNKCHIGRGNTLSIERMRRDLMMISAIGINHKIINYDM
jgi:hypothetical protein